MTHPAERLRPCPFCGGRNVSILDPVDHGVMTRYDAYASRWSITCGACGSHSGTHKTKKSAITAWNTRAEGGAK